MKRSDVYVTLKLEMINLAELDEEERAVVNDLRELQQQVTEWTDYANAYMSKVSDLYLPRGFSRSEITKMPVWRIAQDLNSRLMVREGIARATDYRENLERLISEQFPSRHAFCEAAGISMDTLSQILVNRNQLAVQTLNNALERIGYEMHFVPIKEPVS